MTEMQSNVQIIKVSVLDIFIQCLNSQRERGVMSNPVWKETPTKSCYVASFGGGKGIL